MTIISASKLVVAVVCIPLRTVNRCCSDIGEGTGGAEGAVVSPTKLLEEQLVYPAPPIFFL